MPVLPLRRAVPRGCVVIGLHRSLRSAKMIEAARCWKHPAASDQHDHWGVDMAAPVVSEIPAFVTWENDGLPKTQKTALRLGIKWYFNEKPCLRGHFAKRHTKSGRCYECVRENRGTVGHRRVSPSNELLAGEALSRDERTYIPTKPCKHGHYLRFSTSGNCVECDRIAQERQKSARRFSRLFKEYGVDKGRFYQMLAEQNNRCAICTVEIGDEPGTHVDHCHDTGKVRGLLCSKCNQAIGLLRHSSSLLEAAKEYLRKTADA